MFVGTDEDAEADGEAHLGTEMSPDSVAPHPVDEDRLALCSQHDIPTPIPDSAAESSGIQI